MNKCINCKNSRYTDVKGYIACSFLFSKYNYDFVSMSKDINSNTISCGWAYLHRLSNNSNKDSFGAGVMTNNVPLFKQDFSCKYFMK